MYIFGIISMLLFTFCFIPQIVSILKTKNASGLSLWSWIMVVAGYTAGLLYVVSLRVPILIASYSLGLILSLLTLILVTYYKTRRKKGTVLF